MRRGTKHILSTDTTLHTGGTDLHPEPVNMFLSSLSGCLTATTKFVSTHIKNPIIIRSMDITLEAWRDQSSVLKKPLEDVAVNAGLKCIEGVVELRVGEFESYTDDEIRIMTKSIESRCPISSTILNSDTELNIRWEILPKPEKVNIYGGGLG
jgi:uncharacterized OsmC-like protein